MGSLKLSWTYPVRSRDSLAPCCSTKRSDTSLHTQAHFIDGVSRALVIP